MMSMLRGAITLALLVLFVRLVIWAWSSRRTELFNSMARMPLEDPENEAKSRSEQP
jgi:cytochrome c oxidase cbb3-type subunit 4